MAERRWGRREPWPPKNFGKKFVDVYTFWSYTNQFEWQHLFLKSKSAVMTSIHVYGVFFFNLVICSVLCLG